MSDKYHCSHDKQNVAGGNEFGGIDYVATQFLPSALGRYSAASALKTSSLWRRLRRRDAQVEIVESDRARRLHRAGKLSPSLAHVTSDDYGSANSPRTYWSQPSDWTSS